MSAGKIVLLVFGVIILLTSIGLLFAGGTLMWVDKAHIDSEGFINSNIIQVERDSAHSREKREGKHLWQPTCAIVALSSGSSYYLDSQSTALSSLVSLHGDLDLTLAEQFSETIQRCVKNLARTRSAFHHS